MSKHDIIRAWKDPSYRESLSASARASMPAHPSASVTLTDAELSNVQRTSTVASALCSPCPPKHCL